ncbi:MAG: Uxx-star family glutaredoxin-like (seleno)protein [Candidatus Paceibacterota bacterium]
MAKVTIYSTPTCGFCKAAKDFFGEKGVEYEDFDVSTNAEKRQEMIEKSGQMGVPVITVGDEIMVGFDKNKVSNLLGLSA